MRLFHLFNLLTSPIKMTVLLENIKNVMVNKYVLLRSVLMLLNGLKDLPQLEENLF